MASSPISNNEPYIVDNETKKTGNNCNTEEFYISRAERIEITPYNVDRVYEQICGGGIDEGYIQNAQDCKNEGDYSVVSSMLELVDSLTQDMFIEQLLEDTKNDVTHLDGMRIAMYEALKATADYPFDPKLELKRRRNSRNGDSLPCKLACDIYILSIVTAGADFDDVKEVLNVRSSKFSASDLSMCTQASGSTDIEVLKTTVGKLCADLLEVKQENACLKSDFAEQLKKMRSNISSAITEVENDVKELRELTQINAQSNDRLCSDKSNGNMCIKNDIKLIRDDLKSITEDLESKADLNRIVSEAAKLGSLTKRVSKLEKKCKDDKLDATSTTVPQQTPASDNKALQAESTTEGARATYASCVTQT